ncbi:VOC family protein [Agromyces mediolanus]|uniref:VOC family protein n=1 Tax=Agromyces mediolanus TaxID=41986 RepID=UPI0038326C19
MDLNETDSAASAPLATELVTAATVPDSSAAPPLRGLSTVTLYADDVAAAQRWYTEFLGVEPYFFNPPQPAPPMYVEFRLGDLQHELGIVDRRFAPGAESAAAGARAAAGASAASPAAPAAATATAPVAAAPAQPITYWHVDDVEAVLARLLALGATVHQPVIERGPGFVTASVVDPFGNVLGIMFNRHYLDVVGGGVA